MCPYCYWTCQQHFTRLIILCYFRVWRTRLAEGITGTVLQWFHSSLSGRSPFVEMNHTKTSVRDRMVDVPQGSVLGPILYLLYISPLAEIIRSHGVDYHFYADDTQLYISFKDCDVDVAKLRVENCVADICQWMDVNELKLNHDKTKIMLVYSKYHTRPFFSYFSMVMRSWQPTPMLGVWK